jgi:hypothetical protein
MKAAGTFLAVTLLVGAAVGAHAAPAVTRAGPFEIETVEKRISAGGFPNNSSNPFARMTVTVFRVKHRGKPVIVNDGKVPVDEFWEAKVLDGAPRPALLLMVTGAWLATEDSGALKVLPLSTGSSDLSTWQWLDASDGQPGVEHSVGIRNAGAESRTQSGGSLLLVNRTATVDLATLSVHTVTLNSSENLRKVDQYYAAYERAHVLSPGRTQYVAPGNRNGPTGGYEYALVAVEPATGRVYHLPFDRDALRFEGAHDATPEWIARNFEWKREAGGAERLQPRRNANPAPWLGRVTTGGSVEYRLAPTDPKMFEALYDFVVRTFDGAPGKSSEYVKSRAITVGGTVLHVSHFPEERVTTIYGENAADTRPATALIEKIGARFNEELARGKHQELFTEYRKTN